MYILLTDETNQKPSQKAKFFIYGGVFFKADLLPDLSLEIESIRSRYGYKQGDEFKFDVKSKPDYVTSENCRQAKREAIHLCITSGVRFTVYIVHHGIAKNKSIEELVT